MIIISLEFKDRHPWWHIVQKKVFDAHQVAVINLFNRRTDYLKALIDKGTYR